MKAAGTGGKNSLSNWTLLQIMLKTRFSFLYASTSLVTKTLTIASNRNFESYVNSLSCSSAHLPVFPFLPLVFPLPLATLLIIVSSSSTLHCANEITMKKGCLQWVIFPGKSWSIVIDARRSRCPTGFSFSGGEIISWCEFFANLHELKSRIRFCEEYNHFERIHRVCRFYRFSLNFAKTF